MARVIVIGAGIVGVCAASYLLRDGHAVTLVDPDGFGERTSKGNAGAISPGSCVPLAMPGVFKDIPGWLVDPDGPLAIRPTYLPRALPWLVRFSLAARETRIDPIADALFALHSRVFDAYAPLIKNAGAEDAIRRSGVLYLYETEASFQGSMPEVEMRRRRGVRVELLGQPEIHQLEPLVAERFQHAMFLPEHGHTVNPHRLVNALAQQFLRDGGTFAKAAARGFARHDGKVTGVITDAGTLNAEILVIAAGVWSRALMRMLGHDVPLESQRGYHVMLTDPGIQPRLPVTAVEGKYFATPMEGGLRVAGTVEFGGLNAAPNWRRARVLLQQVKQLYPTIDTSKHDEWAGHRPCLPDSVPAIGAVRGHPNVYAAFGHGHNGMTGGPPTGRAIADLVAGRPAGFDLSPYRPDRF